MSPSVHCKTIKLVSLKKMLTFYQLGILMNLLLFLCKSQCMGVCQSSVIPEMDGKRKKETHSLSLADSL